MGRYGPIRHFMDIEAWKIGREIRKRVYAIVKRLPKEEQYSLGSQMRRAAISVTANIAEGYGRYYYQENIQFCRQSRGSLYELQDHLITCLDEGYTTRQEYGEVYALTESGLKALNGYIRMLQKRKESGK